MTYCFRCPEGHTFALQRAQDQFRAPGLCPECGAVAERDFVAEHGDHFHRPGLWPQHSLAAAVHPLDRVAAMKAASDGGVRTAFDADGRPVFESPLHKKRYLEQVARLYDRDGGYTSARRHP